MHSWPPRGEGGGKGHWLLCTLAQDQKGRTMAKTFFFKNLLNLNFVKIDRQSINDFVC